MILQYFDVLLLDLSKQAGHTAALGVLYAPAIRLQIFDVNIVCFW